MALWGDQLPSLFLNGPPGFLSFTGDNVFDIVMFFVISALKKFLFSAFSDRISKQGLEYCREAERFLLSMKICIFSSLLLGALTGSVGIVSFYSIARSRRYLFRSGERSVSLSLRTEMWVIARPLAPLFRYQSQ